MQTVSSLGSFFLAMILYPQYQEAARAQIDEVCAGRLPDYSDMPDLPYVDALVKESLRWNPVVPISLFFRLKPKSRFSVGTEGWM